MWQVDRMYRILRPKLVLYAAAGLLAAAAPYTTVAASEAAPDFALKALDGNNYRLSEYRGEVVAVVFWASWCGGCRAELQRLQAWQQNYADAGLQVLAVSVDENVEAARAIAVAMGTTFPQLLDVTKSVARTYRPAGLPQTLLIDRTGVTRLAYGELDAEHERQVASQLRLLLDE